MNVAELKAGREMDGAIAVRLMGYTLETDERELARLHRSIVGGVEVPPTWWKHPNWGWCDAVPDYSTDVAMAWKVVALMRTKPFSERYRFRKLLTTEISERLRGSAVTSVVPDLIIHPSEDLLFVEPVDICRAALKSLEVDQ